MRDLFTTTPPLSFAAPRSRRHDPSTSKAAAASMREGAAEHRDRIYRVLDDHGDLTPEQIAAHCELSSVQVCRRMAEMERMGLACPTGERRKNRNGNSARVWRAT